MNETGQPSVAVYTVANAKLTFTGETRAINDSTSPGSAEIVSLETTDGLKGEVSVQFFDDGTIVVRLTEFLSPPPPTYAHLNRNGSMTVQTRSTDGKKVALLRALRPGGKEHATLNSVSLEELDSLLGSDAESWLEELGFELGTWEEINPGAGRFKSSLAVSVDAENVRLLALPWALTRVIALMKKLGKPTLESN
jgi:hypothetical protein